MRVRSLSTRSRIAIPARVSQQDWHLRHVRACQEPATLNERAIVGLCDGLHALVTGLDPNDDGVFVDRYLTPYLGSIMEGIHGLLNLNTGRIDPGLVSAWLFEVAPLVSWDLDRSCPTYEEG